MIDVPESPRARLGRKIRRRRTDLKLSAQAAADLAGVSRTTWTNAEAGGRQLSERLRSSVERALRWEPGSIEAILGGGQPEERTAASPIRDLADEVERIQKMTEIPAKDRVRMVRALFDLYEQAGADSV